jgi:aspartyl protease family protein
MTAAALLLALVLHSAAALAAPSVSLNGSLGPSTALLVIDGQVRPVKVGERSGGVKLLALGPGGADIEVNGQRYSLALGATPVALGAGSAGAGASRVVLFAGSGGHFVTDGSVNGLPVRFMVDTGATLVSLSESDAARLGINFRNGRRVPFNTANGVVAAHIVSLNKVKVGDVEVFGVDAAIVPAALPVALLGNSFLNRFQMRRENDTLTLERRP